MEHEHVGRVGMRGVVALLFVGLPLLAGCAATTKALPGSSLPPPGGLDTATITVRETSGWPSVITLVVVDKAVEEPSHAVCVLNPAFTFGRIEDEKIFVERIPSECLYILDWKTYRAAEKIALRVPANSGSGDGGLGKELLRQAQEQLGPSPFRSGQPSGAEIGTAAATAYAGILLSGPSLVNVNVPLPEFENRACVKFAAGTAVGLLGPEGSLTFGVRPGEIHLTSFHRWAPPIYWKEQKFKLNVVAGGRYVVEYRYDPMEVRLVEKQ